MTILFSRQVTGLVIKRLKFLLVGLLILSLRVARGAEAMSNQQSHPFVAPDEYERNKNTIAGYRAYLDMYERMNEQGLHNHAEFERAERTLQERVRQGEEAQ